MVGLGLRGIQVQGQDKDRCAVNLNIEVPTSILVPEDLVEMSMLRHDPARDSLDLDPLLETVVPVWVENSAIHMFVVRCLLRRGS